MMGKRQIGFAAFGLLLTGTTGCLFNPYHPTAVFDLETVPSAKAANFSVNEFRNNSGAGLRMQLYHAGGVVETLSHSRWNSDPGTLLSRALNRILLPDATSPVDQVKGTLECFRAEPDTRVFRLGGFFRVNKKTVRFDITTPLDGDAPGDIVIAAAAAVTELAKRIQQASEK